jgi:hypothetical protein
MRYQYQGTPETPPALQLSLFSGSSGVGGEKYFWLQYRNRAGYSAVGQVSSINAINGTISITIPSGAKPLANGTVFGVDIQEYVILSSKTNDPSSAFVIATFPGYQVDGTPYELPAVVSVFGYPEVSELTVANEAALPLNPIHGMRRAVANPSQVFAYDAIFSPIGWKPAYPPLLSTYVLNTQFENGADIPISDIVDGSVVITPSYGVDGTFSKSVGFWLVNDSNNEIPEGIQIGVSFDLDNVDVSSQFIGLASITFQGYVDTNTGTLDVSGMIVNTSVPYSGAQTGMVLQKALPVGIAILIQFQLNFRAFQLANRPVQGSVLRVSPYIYSEVARFDPNGAINGSLIAAEFGRRRIVPTAGANAAKALKGTGNISIAGVGAYTFTGVTELDVIGLEPNTANQKAFISINGPLYVADSTIAGARQRALIGTIDGIGHITDWSGSYALDETKALQVVATYPANISNIYPDVVSGNSDGIFNASDIRVYVRPVGGGDIKSFDTSVTVGAPQNFVVGITGTGSVDTIPPTPADNFGLYRAEDGVYDVSVILTTSDFVAGNYEIAIAYVFSGKVTSISHSTDDGNIYEASGTWAELYQAADYWKYAVTNPAALRALPSAGYVNFHRRAIASLGLEVVWNALSVEVDDGINFFKPSDRDVLQPGRYEAIIAQLNKSQTYRAAQSVQVVEYIAVLGGTTTIDLSAGNARVVFEATGDTAISFINSFDGGSWVIHLIQPDTGALCNIEWIDLFIDWGVFGEPPLSENKRDIVTLVGDSGLLFGFSTPNFRRV